MAPNDVDLDQLVAQLASEILAAVDREGKLESWATERLDGSINEAALDKACTQLAEQFLTSDPPQTGLWEHLLVTLAFRSSRTQKHHGLSACKSVLLHLGTLLSEERPEHFIAPTLMTFASAMTVVLAIQYKLTQDIEATIRRLCEKRLCLFLQKRNDAQNYIKWTL